MTRTGRLGLSAATIGAGVLLAPFLPSAGPTLCPFALATGVACPLCGLTRSTTLLLQGEVEASVVLHPLTLPTLAALVAAWAWWDRPETGRSNTVKAAAIAAAFTAVWIARWATGALPPV